MKNSNGTIGNRTRGLPTCSAVPQPTALPAACPNSPAVQVAMQVQLKQTGRLKLKSGEETLLVRQNLLTTNKQPQSFV